MIQTLLSYSDWAVLLLRVVFGLVFLVHGKQKLFGGLSGTAQFFDSVGIRPGKFWAVIAGMTEFFGGILLILGLFTQWAALGLGIVMLVAILKVNLKKGFVSGYEYDLVLLALAISFLLIGGGRYSLDARFFLS